MMNDTQEALLAARAGAFLRRRYQANFAVMAAGGLLPDGFEAAGTVAALADAGVTLGFPEFFAQLTPRGVRLLDYYMGIGFDRELGPEHTTVAVLFQAGDLAPEGLSRELGADGPSLAGLTVAEALTDIAVYEAARLRPHEPGLARDFAVTVSAAMLLKADWLGKTKVPASDGWWFRQGAVARRFFREALAAAPEEVLAA